MVCQKARLSHRASDLAPTEDRMGYEQGEKQISIEYRQLYRANVIPNDLALEGTTP
jgi:hypothetical protein